MNKRICALIGLAALICCYMLMAGSIASEIKNNSNAFIDSGCIGEGYSLNCDSLGLKEKFGCMQIVNASRELDNLSPCLPIVECLYLGNDSGPSQGILREGCMMPLFRKYIVKQGEDFKLIESAADFKSEFAPVETKEEALAFAVALTSSMSRYDTSAPEGYFSVSSKITPTYSNETENGFIVHLFDSELCGCGTHPYYAVDYLVSRDGNVTEIARQEVFNSTRMICFD
ncbi:MAG: hypothetical protein PHQ34_09665 [Methanothrix sp.]|nr:hypothetical protein [Methanothrix sp.]